MSSQVSASPAPEAAYGGSVTFRVSMSSIPLSVSQAELFDTVRCHSGGSRLVNVALFTVPTQCHSFALADYETSQSAKLCCSTPLFINGARLESVRFLGKSLNRTEVDVACESSPPLNCVCTIGWKRATTADILKALYKASRAQPDDHDPVCGYRDEYGNICCKP